MFSKTATGTHATDAQTQQQEQQEWTVNNLSMWKTGK